MKRLTNFIPVSLLVMALVFPVAGTVMAAVVNSGGVLGKFKAVTETITDTTNLTSYRPIDGMARTVITKKRSRLVITFSAESTAADATMIVRCRVNGSAILPNEVNFTSFTGIAQPRVRSYTWITEVLDPGTYNVDMQFKSNVAAETVYLFERTLMIQYKK
jgi:hypothetical protein